MSTPDNSARRRFRLPRPRYADVASTMALVLALGTGGAYAAQHVTSKDIKPRAVKTKHLAKVAVKPGKIAPGAVKSGKIAKGAVKSGKIANGAIGSQHLGNGLLDDLATSGAQGPQGPAGATGPRGPVGPAGAAGPAGPAGGFSGLEVVEMRAGTLSGMTRNLIVSCPGDKVAVSGGHSASADVVVMTSAPAWNTDVWSQHATSPPTGWAVFFTKTGGSSEAVRVFATCIDPG